MKRRGLMALVAVLVAAVLALCAAGCRPGPVNYPRAIAWESYEAGLARAKAERKPVLLLLGADWCGPCHELADRVLSDARVIDASRAFVMVHVNVDQREDLADKYRRGGKTLPRVYFLNADGVLLKGARRPALCNAYDYDHKDPTSLLDGMAHAQRLASDPGTHPDEDPYALTAGDLAKSCALKSTDNRCDACMKTHCCAEGKACLEHAASCLCGAAPPGPASRAFNACMKAQCEAQCMGQSPM